MNPIRLRTTFFITLAALLLTACSADIDAPEYQASSSLPGYEQDSFQAYQLETLEWLAANRIFITSDTEAELTNNAPKEYAPEKPNGQAVLLVHGLGDSPFSFIDVATELSKQGYLVRTLLLPGHGSKVGDLQLASLEDWQKVVKHHHQLLKNEYSQVWLGGYSTGANLVTSLAIQDKSVSGLLLFSPAFQPAANIVSLAPYAQWIYTWADQDPEDNPLRYNSLPMNAAAAYYKSTVIVANQLDALNSYTKPVFVAMSEGDKVIDSEYVIQHFSSTFSNRHNQLVWYGENPIDDIRSHTFTMNLPEKRISNGSHMGLLFAPDNLHYGEFGDVTICSNGQQAWQQELCEQGAPVWYSAWGFVVDDKAHARLTYNPYFDQMMTTIFQVMAANKTPN